MVLKLHQKGVLMKHVRRLITLLMICACFCNGALTAKAADDEKITFLDLDIWLDSEGDIRVDSWQDLYVDVDGNRSAKERWEELEITVEVDRPYRLSLSGSESINFYREDGIIISYQSMDRKNSRKVEIRVEYFVHDGSCYYENCYWENYHDYCDYGNYIYNDVENTVSYYDEHGNRHIIASYGDFCRPSHPNKPNNPSCDSKGNWYYENGDWYYYVNGKQLKSIWKQIDGYWYHFRDNGKMSVGWVDYTYYCNPSKDTDVPYGAMLTGWQQCPVFSGTYWYYFKPVSGEKVIGRACIDGCWYQFDEQGKWIQ